MPERLLVVQGDGVNSKSLLFVRWALSVSILSSLMILFATISVWDKSFQIRIRGLFWRQVKLDHELTGWT